MTSKTELWDRLCKTDPKHTKGFKRSGGFSGTAIKPIWSIHRMTEEFGACGIGWGINEPTFQVVHSGDEVLVYCTVSIWHGARENTIFGVGGDKVVGKNKYGPFTDDEAFKKAFTDAVGNAMKFIGITADVHMGLFEDSKYVSALKEEFSEPPSLKTQISEQRRRDDAAMPDEYDPSPEPIPEEHLIKRDDGIQILTVDAQRPIFAELEKEMYREATVDGLKRWKVSARSRASRLSGQWKDDLNKRYIEYLRQLEKRDADEYIERRTA